LILKSFYLSCKRRKGRLLNDLVVSLNSGNGGRETSIEGVKGRLERRNERGRVPKRRK